MVEDLSTYLRGWQGYFGFCQTPTVLQALISGCGTGCDRVLWKQWKRGRTRFAELHRRGIGRVLAAQTAGSAHGPWRLAASPALSYRTANAYFDSWGFRR